MATSKRSQDNVTRGLQVTVLLLAVAALGYVGIDIAERALPLLNAASVYALESQMVSPQATAAATAQADDGAPAAAEPAALAVSNAAQQPHAMR